MLQLVIIPLDAYNALMKKCAECYLEYPVLKNGFIIRNAEGQQEVHLACDSARAIVIFAEEHCPEVAPYMRTVTDAALWPDN